jgi:hypothetical protein
MKYFLVFAFLTVAYAHHEHSGTGKKVIAYKAAILKYLDPVTPSTTKTQCFKDQFLTTRHDELTVSKTTKFD